MNRVRPLILPLVLVALACVGVGRVRAHAVLVRSTPEANASLAVSPASVQLYFSEAIEPHFSTISVVNTTGKRVNAGDAQVDPADAAHLLLALPSLGDGVYLAVWSVISADDGHQSNTRKYGTERRRPAR